MKRDKNSNILTAKAIVSTVIFILLVGCSCSSLKTPKDNQDVFEGQNSYSYEIEVIFDSTSFSDGRFPIYTFSRPVFEETSELAKEINRLFVQEEKEMYKEMRAAEDAFISFPQDIHWESNYPWKHTKLTECVFEKSGVLSFILNEEWYMGGVCNKKIKGYTFDFNSGHKLSIADVLYGDEAQITVILEDMFYLWYENAYGVELTNETYKNNVKKQSGLAANFYLSKDGIHVFCEPYTLPATQYGIDILIPWKRVDLIQQNLVSLTL